MADRPAAGGAGQPRLGNQLAAASAHGLVRVGIGVGHIDARGGWAGKALHEHLVILVILVIEAAIDHGRA